MPDPLENISAQTLYDTGIKLANGGDLIRAEQYLAAASNKGFPEEEVMPKLIRVCVAAGRLESALNYATPYLKSHPRAWSLRYLVGTLQQGVGQANDAKRNYEIVLRDRENFADAHYQLGLLLMEEEDTDEGEKHLRRYLELEPEGHFSEEVEGILENGALPIEKIESTPIPVEGSP
ncbi:MAG: tetratricopeptide repeat protein [Polyangiales bacterium]